MKMINKQPVQKRIFASVSTLIALIMGISLSLTGLSVQAESAAEAAAQAKQWRAAAATAAQEGRMEEAAQAQANADSWEQLVRELQQTAPAARDPATAARNPASPEAATPANTPHVAVDDRAERLKGGLYQAVAQGDYNRVKSFINQGAQATPELFQVAVEGGYTGIAFLLSRSGTDLDPAVLGRALLKAVNAQDRDRVQNLLKLGANVNYSENNVTPMSIASRQGDMGMIGVLLSQGAQRDSNDLGRMMYQAVEHGEVDKVRNLLKMGANPNYAQDGSTALSLAFDRSDFGMASALIAGGAAADPRLLGQALFRAVERGEQDKVSALIKMGADPNYSNNGASPLTIAIHTENLTVANQLIQAGATDSSGRFGKKAFDAALEGDMAWLNVLAKVPSYANYRNAAGETPLHAAASTGQTDAIVLLLRVGVDPNITTVKNWTPLHHAARFGHQLPLMHLLKAGSDIYAVNSDGYDAYKLATLAPRDPKHSIDTTGVLNYLKLWMQHHPRP